MTLTEWIGVDIGRRLPLEDAIDWAAANQVRHIDIQHDTGANAVTNFDAHRARGIRAAHSKHGVHLRLHTLSAANVAEYSPFLSDAVNSYLKA